MSLSKIVMEIRFNSPVNKSILEKCVNHFGEIKKNELMEPVLIFDSTAKLKVWYEQNYDAENNPTFIGLFKKKKLNILTEEKRKELMS